MRLWISRLRLQKHCISALSSHWNSHPSTRLLSAVVTKQSSKERCSHYSLLIPLYNQNALHLCLFGTFVTFVIAVTDNCRPKTPQVCCIRSRQDVQRLSIESSGKTLRSDFDLSSLHPITWFCVCVCVSTDSKAALRSSALDCGTFTGKWRLLKRWCDDCIAGICCHWNWWLHDWMRRRNQPQCGADGGKGLCFKPAHVYERQRLCHRKDPTSGFQAEWVHHHCMEAEWKQYMKAGHIFCVICPLQLIFGWSTKLWRNLEATIPWVVLALSVCINAKQASKEKKNTKKSSFSGRFLSGKTPQVRRCWDSVVSTTWKFQM